MKLRNYIYILGVAAVLFLVACQGCSGLATGFTKIADAVVQPSAREVYMRGYKDFAIGL